MQVTLQWWSTTGIELLHVERHRFPANFFSFIVLFSYAIELCKSRGSCRHYYF